MPGLGFRTFVPGEVLTAANVQGYLQDQAVMVFGGTAARSSAIPTPSEGMVCVLTDSDQLVYYNGSAWVTGLPFSSWAAYTPTLSGLSNPNGSLDFKFTQIGKTVHVRGLITLGAGFSFSGGVLDIGVPVNWTGYILGHTLGNVTYTNNSSYFLGTNICVGNVSFMRVIVGNAASTFLGISDINATSPFTWASTHKMFLTYTYEAA
jgi:hypothetical protein